jgi:hypothetical protein
MDSMRQPYAGGYFLAGWRRATSLISTNPRSGTSRSTSIAVQAGNGPRM